MLNCATSNIRVIDSVMSEHPETDAARDKKDRRSLPHQKRRQRLTKKYPRKVQATDGKAVLEQEERIRAEISLKESVRTRHVIIGTLPCVSQIQV